MLVKTSFLTSQESRTALQWVASRVPAAAPTCHLRVRPHALSLTSGFITLRGMTWPRDRIPTSVNITPLQQPVVLPPRDSHFERICDARSSRMSHVATRFTLGPPRTSEGFLPLHHACIILCMKQFGASIMPRTIQTYSEEGARSHQTLGRTKCEPGRNVRHA